MLFIRATNAYREGHYAAAVRDAEGSVASVPVCRANERPAPGMIACAAAARLGRSADAQRHCAGAREVDGLQRDKRLWLEVQLADAEVKLILGNPAGATEQVTTVLPDLESTQSSADRWRSFAVLAGAATGIARTQAREQLTRELRGFAYVVGRGDLRILVTRGRTSHGGCRLRYSRKETTDMSGSGGSLKI